MGRSPSIRFRYPTGVLSARGLDTGQRMWLGPGGIIALVLAGWGCVWAGRRTSGRPVADWLGTALSIVALQAGVALVTAQGWLAVGYHDAARVLSVTERAVLLDLMSPSYGPLLWGAGAVLVFLLGLARSRAGWSEGRRPSTGTLAYALAQALLLAGSTLSVGAFWLVFVSGGAETVNRQGALVASEVLLVGSALAWVAIALALGWLGVRGARMLRPA